MISEEQVKTLTRIIRNIQKILDKVKEQENER